MGTTLAHHPSASIVLAAHAAHLDRQAPTVNRYVNAPMIADHPAGRPPEQAQQYLAVLDRHDWCDSVRANLDPDNEFFAWGCSAVPQCAGR